MQLRAHCLEKVSAEMQLFFWPSAIPLVGKAPSIILEIGGSGAKASWIEFKNGQRTFHALRLEVIALRFEAIALRLEAIASRLEAIASRLEAIPLRLEAIASRLEAIPLRLKKGHR